MADQKVSDLPSLSGADVDPADLLYIIDSSAGSAGSKKITVGQYQLAPVTGGTANGVVYLNASKVATAGSDLVFDGTNFSTTGTATATKLIPTGGSATGNGVYLPAANTLGFSTNGAQAMTLDANGNLGVGTSSPQTKAHISGASTTSARVGCTGGSGVNLDLTATSTEVQIGSPNGVALLFNTTNTERARITSGGSAYIGTTTSLSATDYRLQVTHNTSCSLFQTSAVAAWPVACWNTAASGDNLFAGFFTEGGAGTQRGSIDYNRAGGLTRYNTTSDYRAKDIIGPVQNPGATIDALKVYEGVMKGATQSRPMLIAHEAQAVAPYAVSGVKDEVNEDGTPKFQQMDVSSLVPLLLAEIQCLRARVAALESA